METEAPEEQKVLDRLQEYTDEAGRPDRMQKISNGFNQSIAAIKQWLTRFGLKSSSNMLMESSLHSQHPKQQPCEVQLDMEINVANKKASATEESKQAITASAEEPSTIEGRNEAAEGQEPEHADDPWKAK